MENFINSEEKMKNLLHNRGLKWFENLQNLSGKNIIFGSHVSITQPDSSFKIIMKNVDVKFFTDIIFLDYNPLVIYNQRKNDKVKVRKEFCVNYIKEWQKFEKENLFKLFKNSKKRIVLVKNHKELELSLKKMLDCGFCFPKKRKLFLKKMILIRGVSGSGKSTMAKSIIKKYKNGVILSSDDYFEKNGLLRLPNSEKLKLLQRAHQWNELRANVAVKNLISPIIVDNCFLRKWEAKFYVKLAVKNNYCISIKETQTEWKRNEIELAKRNIHKNDINLISLMLKLWEDDFTVDNILNSEFPKDFIPY